MSHLVPNKGKDLCDVKCKQYVLLLRDLKILNTAQTHTSTLLQNFDPCTSLENLITKLQHGSLDSSGN